MTLDDLPATWEIVGDDETMYSWNGAWSEQENIVSLEKQLRGYAENGFGRWAVVLKETGRVIGMCGLMWWDTDKDRVLELGYLFNRAFWRNGYICCGLSGIAMMCGLSTDSPLSIFSNASRYSSSGAGLSM
jgi:RimJ/RimL family protein N-acetyltransferase